MSGAVAFGRWLVATLVVTATLPTLAAETTNEHSWSLVIENDLFFETDRDYTSGLAVTWVSREPTPAWALSAARALPWFPQEGRVLHGYAIGQAAFTPEDIALANPPPDDRPYAGWLYGTIGLGAETGIRVDQFSLSLGIVGPAALAEETQKAIHAITGSENPQGWDYQLGNEPGVVLTYQRSWRHTSRADDAGLAWGLTPHVGGALGNVYTYLEGGATLRFGHGLGRDLGPPRLQPSLPGSGYFVANGETGWYLFVGAGARAVAHNIFLDGNSFKQSRSVDKEPLVGDLQWGLAVTLKDLRLSFTQVTRTHEFETQTRHDHFGALTVSQAF